jgi:hypothetical protein
MRRAALLGLCALALGLASASAAQAQAPSCDDVHQLTWKKDGGGDFTSESSWEPECLPRATTVVDLSRVPAGASVTGLSGSVAGMTTAAGVRLDGGSLTVLGTLSLATADTTFDTHVNADISVAGATTIAGDGRLFIDTDNTVDLNAVSWSGAAGKHGTVLSLNGTARLNVAGPFAVTGEEKVLEGSLYGVLALRPGSSFVTAAPLRVHAAHIDSAGTMGGALGQTLVLDEVRMTLQSGGAVRGRTLVMADTSTVTLAGDPAIDDGELEVSAGVVAGAGRLGGGGRFLWTGGHLDGAFSTGPDLHFDVAGALPKFVEGVDPGTGALTLRGPSRWGEGTVHLKTAQVALRNEGTMRVEPGAVITGDDCCVFGEPQLTNTGTILTEGDGERTIALAPVTSSGKLDLAGGRLRLQSLRQTDGQLWLRGGTLAIDGAPPALPPAPIDLAGGELAGTGTLEAAVTSAGVVRPGAPDADGATGTLTIGGAYVQVGGGRLVADLASGAHDTLRATGPVTLAGTLEARTASGYTPGFGVRADVVRGASRAGSFGTLAGAEIAGDRRWFATDVADGTDLVVTPKPVGPPADTRPPQVQALTIRHRTLRQLRLHGLPLTLRVDEAARLTAELLVDRATARRLHLAGAAAGRKSSKPVRIGRLVRSLRRGTNRFTVRLDRAAAKRLGKAKAKRVRVTVRLTLRDAADNATVRTRSLTATRR